MILASISSPDPALSWVWLIAASIGGIVVFIGLLLEKIAEWKNERFSPPFFKPYKCLGEWGWVILMIGIALEIGVGFALAWKDERDINDAKNAALNQPIVTGSATVSLFLSGETNRSNVGVISRDGLVSTNGYAFLSFCRLEQVSVGINMDDHVLLCSDWRHPDPNMWSFKFDQGTATYFANDTWVRDVKKWNVTGLFIPSLHRDTEVVGGRIVLTVNSTSFDNNIPPQKVIGRDDWVNFLKAPHAGVFVIGQ